MIFWSFFMYILYFHVPETHLDTVKNAIFSVGAGNIDNYSHCAWQTLGEGQFMPLPGSKAFIGEINKLNKVPEYKVEIICTEAQIKPAVLALKQAHPYETPSYQIVKFDTLVEKQTTKNEVEINGKLYPFAVGREGIKSANEKREGDGGTPEGTFPLIPEIWYRADKIKPEEIQTDLPLRPIQAQDGWCDDPKSPQYNKYVKLPFNGSHEKLFREDDAYDLFMVISWNPDGIPEKGSAIFLHVARESLSPTRGCIAFRKEDLLEIIQFFSPKTQITISQTEGISFTNLINQK